MGLLRNREVKALLLAAALIGGAGTVFCAFISPVAAVVTGVCAASMIAAFLLFIRWRYRQLDRLADCLKRVNGGDYALEVRDNDEGELSILKSEIYKVTLMLREQNGLLKREKSLLSDSLSDISHQLKTPLTSLFVMTDLLCGDGLDEEQRAAFTDRIRAQLERLQWLVESLLKLSKLDAKAIPFNRRPVVPDELIAKACAPLLIPMELKEQRLTVETDGVPFACDPAWTAEALLNVLKNGMEHTPRGGKIHVRAVTNPLFTQIAVSDSGGGIDPADLPYIFNRLYKGKNAGGDSVGIGLAMARSIAEGQGGTLDAHNESDGAVFLFRFPRAAESGEICPVTKSSNDDFVTKKVTGKSLGGGIIKP